MPQDSNYKTVQIALAGGNGADQQQIAEAAMDLIALLLCKNSDYGGSAWKSPIFLPDEPADRSMFSRLSDKVARLASLQGQPGRVSDETVTDTLMDMAGYCILLVAFNRKCAEEPEPEPEPAPARERSGIVCGSGFEEVMQQKVKDATQGAMPAKCCDDMEFEVDSSPKPGLYNSP